MVVDPAEFSVEGRLSLVRFALDFNALENAPLRIVEADAFQARIDFLDARGLLDDVGEIHEVHMVNPFVSIASLRCASIPLFINRFQGDIGCFLKFVFIGH